jgi:hypothetical protein
MEPEWIIRLILFSIIHWILAGIMLQDLASGKKIIFGPKALWAILILIVPGFGSLFYLSFHPRILNPENNRDSNDDNRHGE